MAGGITVNSPNREINQEDHRENHSPATSSGSLLGQKRDATYVVDTEQSSWKRHARPKKSIQEETQRRHHHEPSTSKTNRAPYCTFHKRKTHDTSKCRQLQEALLKKYQRGEIQDVTPSTFPFRSRLQPGTDRTGNGPPANQETARTTPLANNSSGPSQQNNQASVRHEVSTSARLRSSQNGHSTHIILGGQNSDKDYVRSTEEHHRKSESAAKWKQPDRVDLARNDLPIVFSEADTAGLDLPHYDSLVITLAIDNCDVTKIQIDSFDVTKI